MLILTKLQRPSVSDDLVERNRLVERLEQGRSRKLTLVSAPAGYGKSSLVSAWLAAVEYPCVWYSIDGHDTDLSQFVEYLVTGIREQIPGSCTRTSTLLQATEPPPLSVFAAGLINDLAEIDAPLLFALDDYHLIDGTEPAALVASLLEHLPRQSHIILITRQDPELPLTRYRAGHQMLEVRSMDLRFTEDETASFLANVTGAPLAANTVHLLSEKTEGWAVGLRLTALLMRDSRDVAELEARLGVTHGGLIIDYLVSEVLSKISPELRDFLLKTSICTRFSAPLCDALLTRPAQSVHAREHIDALVRANAFIISIDGSQVWWRYHHLFQELIQHQLRLQHSTQEIVDLHRLASAWFADQNLLEEAFEHALAAGDVEAAATLLERHRYELITAHRWRALERLLSQLPDEMMQSRPELLLSQARVNIVHQSFASIPTLVTNLESLWDEQADVAALRAEAQSYQAIMFFWMGNHEHALALLSEAMCVSSPSTRHFQGDLVTYYAIALQMEGQQQKALRRLDSNYILSSKVSPAEKNRSLLGQCLVNLLAGELDMAEAPALKALGLSDAERTPFADSWMNFVLALRCYARNRLDDALRYFEYGVENRHIMNRRAAIDNLAGKALTYQALNEPGHARSVLSILQDFTENTGNLRYLAVVRSCQARLALMQGKPQSAAHWLQSVDIADDTAIPVFWFEIPRMTECRVLIGQRDPADVRAGMDKLEQLRLIAEETHNTYQLIHINVLRAVGYHRLGQSKNARQVLDDVLVLATPGRWIRPFVDLGESMETLLHQAAPRHPQGNFIQELLAAFPPPRQVAVQAPPEQMPEPLTERESEILALLAQRFSNQEIAAELVISVTTVKRHASNIYQKLHVKNRRQAVERATLLGLLAPRR